MGCLSEVSLVFPAHCFPPVSYLFISSCACALFQFLYAPPNKLITFQESPNSQAVACCCHPHRVTASHFWGSPLTVMVVDMRSPQGARHDGWGQSRTTRRRRKLVLETERRRLDPQLLPLPAPLALTTLWTVAALLNWPCSVCTCAFLGPILPAPAGFRPFSVGTCAFLALLGLLVRIVCPLFLSVSPSARVFSALLCFSERFCGSSLFACAGYWTFF